MPIHNESNPPPISGRFDFNRLMAQHLRRYKVTSLLQLTYEQELEIKHSALERYFEQHRLPGKVEAVIASPRPRHYRTTSKRRIEVHQGRVSAELDHIELEALPNQAHLYLLEPETHRQIYDLLLGYLEKPAYREFAKHVNFIIIRGTYEQHSVIFNVDQFDAEVVRKGKLLTEHLQESPIPILSTFMFLDPSRSDYYFESRRPDAHLIFKKLFGPDMLSIELEGKRFFYEPTGFSQVNLSMVPELIRVVKELLPADKLGMLLDLYCGYGLFGLHLADAYAGVIGLDAAPGAIRAAVENHKHFSPEANVVFQPASLDGRNLRRLLPDSGQLKEYVVLDPPRQGTAHGVIETLAGRKPAAVVHIFCGLEQLPREVPNWLHAGYRLDRIVPLDLFPGTANLECCLLFTPRPEAPSQVSDREVKRKTPYRRKEEDDRPYKRGDDASQPYGQSKDYADKRDEGMAEERRKPGGGRPSSGRPSSGRPSSGRPSSDRPYKRREEGDKPRSDRPYRGKPEDGKPASGRPSSGRPSSDRPSSGGHPSDRPYKRREEGDKPRSDRPYRGKPEDGKPSSGRPSSGRPSSDRPCSLIDLRPAGHRPTGPTSAVKRATSPPRAKNLSARRMAARNLMASRRAAKDLSANADRANPWIPNGRRAGNRRKNERAAANIPHLHKP